MFKVVIKSLTLLAICVFLNQVFAVAFGRMSPAMEVLAPINEEVCRFISVLQGSPMNFIYTAIFSSYEYLDYIRWGRQMFGGVLPYPLMIARVICIMLHFLFLFCQFYGWKLSIKYNDKSFLRLGFVLAVLLHYAWNTQAIYLLR